MGNCVVYQDSNGYHGLTPSQVRENFDKNIPVFFFKLFSGTKRCYPLMYYQATMNGQNVKYWTYKYGTGTNNNLCYSVPSSDTFTDTQPS